MKLNDRDRRALILGGTALGLIVLYFGGIEPLAEAHDELVNEHDRLAGRVARAVRDNRKAEYFSEQIAEYEQAAGELSPPKPYDEQITTVGEQILATAQKSGIQLRGATPTAAVPWAEDPAFQMALFHIDAEAGWESVFKFVGSLYRIPGVLSVERLDLSSKAKKGGPSRGGPPARGGPPGRGGGGPRGGGGSSKVTMRLTVSVLVAAAEESDDPWAR